MRVQPAERRGGGGVGELELNRRFALSFFKAEKEKNEVDRRLFFFQLTFVWKKRSLIRSLLPFYALFLGSSAPPVALPSEKKQLPF